MRTSPHIRSHGFAWSSLFLASLLAWAGRADAGDTLRHEIGWQSGIRYMHHGEKFSLGLRLSPALNYGDDFQNASDQDVSASTQTLQTSNDETRALTVGLVFSKTFKWNSGLLVEPYLEPGYGYLSSESFRFSTHNSYDVFGRTQYSPTYELTKRHDHMLLLNFGLAPGFLLFDHLKIRTHFGVSAQASWSRTEGESRRDSSTRPFTRRNTRANLNSFGLNDWTRDLSIAVLF